jgi:RNA polymerase sigma factor (sigma-70 family)
VTPKKNPDIVCLKIVCYLSGIGGIQIQMQELDDIALLRQYTEQNSEEAFTALVSRHVNKVYSVALRHTRNPYQAEEITQAVFVILAKKSQSLGKRVVLSGWLYETSRLTAVTFIRSEIRRVRREQEAYMQTVLNENESDLWPQIAPLLDTAMARLSETDRHAVVLRFFDGKSMREVGAALGAGEDAAKMRVNRAVEKLRGFFTKRGVVLPAATLIAAISANSVQAAPAVLAKTATAIAFAKGATVSGSTLTLIKGALKVMAWAKAKTAIAAGVVVVLIAGTTTTLIVQNQHRVKAQVDFPKSSWATAGHADPPSALAAILWASNQNDGKAVVAGLTPELEQQFQQRFAPILQKQNISVEEFFTQNSKNLSSAITGFRVLDQKAVSDDQVVLHLYVQGREREDTFKMKKLGNEWRVDQLPPDY